MPQWEGRRDVHLRGGEVRQTLNSLAVAALLSCAVSSVASAQIAVPILTSLVPRICCDADSTILIVGRNFSSASTVRIAGIPFPTIPSAQLHSVSGVATTVVSSDTLLIVHITTAKLSAVWEVAASPGMRGADGGAYVEVKDGSRSTLGTDRLYRRPTIRSVTPLNGSSGTAITIAGSGMSMIHAKNDEIAFVEGPDGKLIPLKFHSIAGDAAVHVSTRYGFRKSPIHIRSVVDGGLVIEAISADSFTASGAEPRVTGVTPRVCCGSDSLFLIFGNGFQSGSVAQLGGTRVKTIPAAMIFTPSGTAQNVVANDTVLIVRLDAATVSAGWSAARTPMGMNGLIDAEGGAMVSVRNGNVEGFGFKRIYRRPTITSIKPQQGSPTTWIEITGSGLSDAAVPLVEGASGKLLPLRAGTTLESGDVLISAMVGPGFKSSPIHLRGTVDGDVIVEAVSAESFTITGTLPMISSVYPRICCTADSVILIVGSNFTPSSIVRLGSVSIPTLATARLVDPTAGVTSVTASDTLLIAQLSNRLVSAIWSGGRAVQPDDDGGEQLTVRTVAGDGYAIERVYRRPTITSVRPAYGDVGEVVALKGTGFTSKLGAFVSAPDGRLVAMRNVTSLNSDDLRLVIPYGFVKSSVHVRWDADGMLVEAVSADQLEVSGVPKEQVATGLGLVATGMAPKVSSPPPVPRIEGHPGTGSPADGEGLQRRVKGVTLQSAPPSVTSCGAGCFSATVSGARPATFDGRAAVEASDGSRYSIMLRDKTYEGHYIALHRMEGGIPGAGTFKITNTCGEAGYTADQKLFQVEYHLNDYRNEEQVTFVGKSGTVIIESTVGERARGRYDITACRELGEGKLEEVHLRGTFDVLR